MSPPAAPGDVLGTPLRVQLFDAFLGERVSNIAWLAGLLEGEGAFTICGGGVAIGLNMTDRDVVERSARMVKAPSVAVNNRHQINHKTCYRWTLCGNAAAGVMMTIFPFMGERRRARIKELLAYWRSRKPRYENAVHCPHPDRPSYGRGLCQQCHGKDWYQRNREKVIAANKRRYHARRAVA